MENEPMTMDKLSQILQKSKTIMDKVDDGDYTTGHIDKNTLVESETPITIPKTSGGYNEEQVLNSKLPSIIKEAMIKKQIPDSPLTSTFSISDLNIKPTSNKETEPKQKLPQNKVRAMEITESELDELVKNKVIEVLGKFYNKTLTEKVVNATINKLVTEGRLKK